VSGKWLSDIAKRCLRYKQGITDCMDHNHLHLNAPTAPLLCSILIPQATMLSSFLQLVYVKSKAYTHENFFYQK
jgi:hypothetical protein